MERRKALRVLGLDDGFSEKELISAYRKLAKRYHPDLCKEKNAAEIMKDINAAYEYLKENSKASSYDSFDDFYSTPKYSINYDKMIIQLFRDCIISISRCFLIYELSNSYNYASDARNKLYFSFTMLRRVFDKRDYDLYEAGLLSIFSSFKIMIEDDFNKALYGFNSPKLQSIKTKLSAEVKNIKDLDFNGLYMCYYNAFTEAKEEHNKYIQNEHNKYSMLLLSIVNKYQNYSIFKYISSDMMETYGVALSDIDKVVKNSDCSEASKNYTLSQIAGIVRNFEISIKNIINDYDAFISSRKDKVEELVNMCKSHLDDPIIKELASKSGALISINNKDDFNKEYSILKISIESRLNELVLDKNDKKRIRLCKKVYDKYNKAIVVASNQSVCDYILHLLITAITEYKDIDSISDEDFDKFITLIRFFDVEKEYELISFFLQYEEAKANSEDGNINIDFLIKDNYKEEIYYDNKNYIKKNKIK